MLGLFLIYFIGKAFYDLAQEHNKNNWVFAILGVVSYYGGTIIAGFVFGLLAELGVTDFFIELPEIGLSLFALPIGILTCWVFYKILSNNWSNQSVENVNDALDGDLISRSGNKENSNQGRNENI